MDTIEILMKRDLAGRAKGTKIVVEARDGAPTDQFWRRRLADAEIDGCCEIVKTKPKAKTYVKKVKAEESEQ
jgi:hypothetical protein